MNRYGYGLVTFWYRLKSACYTVRNASNAYLYIGSLYIVIVTHVTLIYNAIYIGGHRIFTKKALPRYLASVTVFLGVTESVTVTPFDVTGWFYA